MISINVSQLLRLPPGTTRDVEFRDSLPEIGDEIQLTRPVEGRAHLIRTSRGIVAAVTYRTAAELSCARCLTPVTAGIEGSSSDEFMPRVDIMTGLPLEEQAESEELVIDEQHQLNLSEIIRQDILTRIPLQPLCEAACPGLCPDCGQELRSGACSCARPVESSSPFAGLAELLRRDASNGGD